MTWRIGTVILWTGLALSWLPGCAWLNHCCGTCTEGTKPGPGDERPLPPVRRTDDMPDPGGNNFRPGELPLVINLDPPRPVEKSTGGSTFLAGQRKQLFPTPTTSGNTPAEADGGLASQRADYPAKLLGPEQGFGPFPGLGGPNGVFLKPDSPSAADRTGASGPLLPPARKEPLVLSLEKFLQHRPDDAIKDLKHYDAESQEFFLRLLPVLAHLTQKKLSQLDQAETAVLYDQLDSLLSTLRARAELVIDQICFCESSGGFGVYQPVPENHVFRAESDDQPGERVQIYVQLRNLCCAKRGQYFEACLASSAEVVDQHGARQYAIDFNKGQEPVLKSLTPRRDYSFNCSFSVPRLRPGAYTLILEVRDRTRPGVERVARKALPFRVMQ